MQPDLLHHTAIRWLEPDPKHVPLLAGAGVTIAVSPPHAAFEAACRTAGIGVAHEADMRIAATVEEAAKTPSAAVKAGLWPGIQRQDPQTASATRSVWLDQNCALVNSIRALHPTAPRVLAYVADKQAGVSEGQLIPYDGIELALVDAWVAGGNYLMTPDPRLLKGVLGGVPEALAAWKHLGKTAAWLRANEPLFRELPLPVVTVLADSDMSQEIANLSFRQSVSPRVVNAANPPAPDPAHCQVLVAVSIDKPSPAAARRILSHAEAGASVVVDGAGKDAWWRSDALKPARSDAEREFLTLGKGQVVAYKADVEDPGSLALDVIDILTQKRRAARVWNANAALAIATSAPAGQGAAALHVINYGRPAQWPVLARIQGAFRRATLLTPDDPPAEIPIGPRAGGSEVSIPKLRRVATVVFN
ncbi:MAG: hypothetical protein JSU00_00395 [Acidobacteria bacterium]|nr:hypothetical protein [Acidobacteriota bacterium]